MTDTHGSAGLDTTYTCIKKLAERDSTMPLGAVLVLLYVHKHPEPHLKES